MAVMFFCACSRPRDPAELLPGTVSSYWNALAERDLARARSHVAPESRASIDLGSFVLQGWELRQIRQVSETRAEVVVIAEQLVPGFGDPVSSRIVQVWFYDGTGWRVQIPELPPGGVSALLYGTGEGRKTLQTELNLAPNVLKMHFLNPVQRGNFYLRNGLEISVELLRIQIDENRFRVIRSPGMVGPGETAQLTLEYTGEEIEKDLRSEAVLVVDCAGQEMTFRREIVYNHLSPEIKAFFGLTEESARGLGGGVRLEPKLKNPDQAKGSDGLF